MVSHFFSWTPSIHCDKANFKARQWFSDLWTFGPMNFLRTYAPSYQWAFGLTCMNLFCNFRTSEPSDQWNFGLMNLGLMTHYEMANFSPSDYWTFGPVSELSDLWTFGLVGGHSCLTLSAKHRNKTFCENILWTRCWISKLLKLTIVNIINFMLI